MRPIYETELNREKEESIRLELERLWGLVMQKIEPTSNRGMRYKLDCMAMRNNVGVAMVEIKDRSSISSRQYPTINLSLDKYNKGMEFFLLNGLPFIYAVRFKNGIHYYKNHANDRWPIIWWGRNDRGDPADWEPCVAIDSARFKRA